MDFECVVCKESFKGQSVLKYVKCNTCTSTFVCIQCYNKLFNQHDDDDDDHHNCNCNCNNGNKCPVCREYGMKGLHKLVDRITLIRDMICLLNKLDLNCENISCSSIGNGKICWDCVDKFERTIETINKYCGVIKTITDDIIELDDTICKYKKLLSLTRKE